MQQEKRWFPRYAVREDVASKVSVLEGPEIAGTPVDISCGGAYLGGIQLDDRLQGKIKGRVRLCPRGLGSDPSDHILRDCEVFADRAGDSGGCAVRFFTPLDGSEVARLARAPRVSQSLDLARDDCRVVNDEIISIQACRNQIFIGALAVISAWVIAAIGIGLPNSLTFPLSLAIGASFPYIILSIALFATIEKTNAINLRRGFLAAVTDYIRGGVAPPEYLGWAHLRINRGECDSRTVMGLCGRDARLCWEDANAAARQIMDKRPLVTGGLKSFTAFVVLIYGLLYSTASVLMIVAGGSYFLKVIESPVIALLLGFGLGAAVIGLMIYLISHLKQLRRGGRSPEAYYCEWSSILRACRPIMAGKKLRQR